MQDTRPRLRIDIETYSAANLRDTQVYRYAEDPTFEILMAAYRLPGEDTTRIALGQDAVMKIPGLLDPAVVKVAMNSQFERVCFSAASGLVGCGAYLDPRDWHDPAAVCAEYGYPTSLGGAAKALGAQPKDEAGTRLISLFCKPNRKGERNRPEDFPEDWEAFIRYCVQDVDTLVEVDDRVGYDFPTAMERNVFIVDQMINDWGIKIDIPMAEAAVEAAADNRMIQELRVQHLTGMANPNSRNQFLAWCQAAISPRIKNVQKATVEKLLESTRLSPVVREVLHLRQELALTAPAKYVSALASVCADGRLHGTLKFFGAHTGRWSGKGTQVQNLPSGSFEDADGEWDGVAEQAAITDLLLGLGASAADLKKLVRALFVGPFTVVDYAAIEARVIAWLAGEAWAIQAFLDGRDIYVETGQRMGGLSRKQGKVAVLALGYQGAINSLRAMGAEGTDQELKFLVNQWRKANPNIVRLWWLLSEAVAAAMSGPEHERHPVGEYLAISRVGETMRMHLPSGRAIHYHGFRWERYFVINEQGRKEWKEGWRYDDPKKPGLRIGTYGGRLAENATQAVARDIMAWALVRLVRAGYRVAAHVHDEIVVEGTYPVAEISRIMCQVPKWATGLPIAGAGFNTKRYRKD